MYDIYDKAGNYIMVPTSDTTEMREDIYYRIKCSIERELKGTSESRGGNGPTYNEMANRAQMKGQSFREFSWILFTCTNAHSDWVANTGCFAGTQLTPELDLGPALAKILGGGW